MGTDCNPIALLITKAKLINVEPPLEVALNEVEQTLLAASLAPSQIIHDLPEFAGRDHWFSPTARREFGLITDAINQFARDSDEWTALAAVVSSIVTRFSNQDSETRYARVEKAIQPGTILKTYLKRLSDFVAALDERGPLTIEAQVFEEDFGTQTQISDGTVDQIVTSPPYANTMDYYLYHKQRMNLLGFNFKDAQHREIGSRHEYSSQKQSSSKWNTDLKNGLTQCYKVLRLGGTATYIIGDSQIAGVKLDAGKMVCDLAKEVGFDSQILKSEPMSGKSRLFSKAFQAPNKFEHTILLIK
jgi:site-specific DNA-methyltransferase (cytosine-N4-specific)